jgi:hypothetical protein
MAFFLSLLIYVVTFLITELLRPKPNLEDAKPAGLGDFQVPTATEGRVVPIIWGRVKVAGPNVVWYGDLIANPITEKVKTGLFSSDTVTTGFRYEIGLQMALCRGPVDLLVNIRNDESFVWGEDAPSADTPIVPVDAGTSYAIDEPSFFGGEESGGGGGLVGGGRLFPGTETQAISAYLSPFQTPTPAYRGTCYLTWERGEVGLSPSLRRFEFELQRIPDGLDLATVQPGDEEIDFGANPMNVIYEILNNSEWGLNIGPGNIDVPALRAIAATCKAEGQGFAWIWDRKLDVLEVIRLIEEQLDGVLFADPVSGAYSFKLIRFDYTPGTLPLLDETNVRRINRFQRPSWADTTNNITVEFTDRRKNYTQSFALAQDMANVEIVKALNTGAMRYPGVKNPTLANDIAWRELRALSFPMSTGQIVTDRSQWDLVPGDVREWSWGRLGLVRLPIRVVKVDRGQILKNEIKVDFTQDVFSIAPGTFTAPTDTGWIPVASEAQPSLRERVWEVPWQLSLNNERHLAVLCSRDGGLHISFDVYSTRVDPPNFGLEGTENDFTPTALITAAISRDKGDVTPFTQDITVDGLNDITVAELAAAGSTTVNPNDPTNVFLIDDELFFYETVLDLGGGSVTLEECHAGLFDTVPADHVDDSVVWFIGHGLGLLQRDGPLVGSVFDVKILPQTIRNILDIGSAAAIPAVVGQRINDPIPPGDPMMNGERFHDLDGWTRAVGTLDFTWNTRNRQTQGFDTKQDDADLQQSGDVGGHVVVRRVDTTAAVVDFDNIFSDQFITTGFIPQSSPGIPDELDFTAEISNTTTAGAESQIASTVAFEVFGFGIDFGGDFGGDATLPNNGIVLDAGAPPFTPEPVPGSGQDRIWTIDFLGAVNAGEDRRYLLYFTDTLNQQSVLGVSFFMDAATFPTLEAMAEEFREQAQTFIDFPAVSMPFTVSRNGTQLRMTAAGLAGAVRFTPGEIFKIQDAAPPATAIRQIVFFDWFERDFDDPTAQNDLLSPTNDPAFQIVAPNGPNKNRFFLFANTWEAFQEIDPDQDVSGLFTIGGFQDGSSDARTTQIPEFYEQMISQDAVQFFESVEGPLAFRGGLDNPMQRTGIVIEMADNYEIRPQTHQNAVDAVGVAQNAGGFKFLVKEGRAGVAGSSTGLLQVHGVGIGNNRNATPGATLSYTLDGTVFSEIVPAIPATGTNIRLAWIDLLAQVAADSRFEVVNVIDDVQRLSVVATITAATPNTAFEAFADLGAGLRVEFRDISP